MLAVFQNYGPDYFNLQKAVSCCIREGGEERHGQKEHGTVSFDPPLAAQLELGLLSVNSFPWSKSGIVFSTVKDRSAY